jgi:hypothetical protein
MYKSPDTIVIIQLFFSRINWLASIQNIFDIYAVGCNTLVYVVHFRQKEKLIKFDSGGRLSGLDFFIF